MGAMIIFSMLSLNASHFFRTAEQFQYQNAIQYNGIAVAQDKIEEIRWISDEQRFKTSSSSFIENDYPVIETQIFGSEGEFVLEYSINVTVVSTNIAGSNASNYLITVLVSNEYLAENQVIKMDYIKSFGD